jgi:hypothetical protein
VEVGYSRIVEVTTVNDSHDPRRCQLQNHLAKATVIATTALLVPVLGFEHDYPHCHVHSP